MSVSEQTASAIQKVIITSIIEYIEEFSPRRILFKQEVRVAEVILFDVHTNYILRERYGTKLGERKISDLGYADDTALIAIDLDEMKMLLE